ncbi:hypothetical protein [Mesorhizobium sp. BR-1-1-10]|uniref:hypothetical protein n=1 Tax=Mesorhizobium sp. BR-1-1-10 TaxID=2876660 RepID=UPI001CD0E609|nr:hypothetical protein [Mesorhizobium sp. BR-1-1-10]MBZ9975471.1 hypothetical protein [Mesorhizobium sp. BR-1-1-10]
MFVGVSPCYPDQPLNGYDPATSAYIARMTEPPTPARAALYDSAIVRPLKAANVWDLFDSFLLIGMAVDSQGANLNLIDANYTLVPVNSPTFVTDRGYNLDGVTSYLRTSMLLNSLAKFKQNAGHIGVWCNSAQGAATGRTDFGAQDATARTDLRSYNTVAGDVAYRLNTLTIQTATTVANELGHTVINRTGSSAQSVYKNGAALTTFNQASTGLPSVELFLGANNNLGVAGGYTSRRYSAFHVGAPLTPQNVADINGILSAGLTAVGAA